MGCGNSTELGVNLAAVEIHGLKQSWNGIASAKFFSEPNVLQCKKVLTESSAKAYTGGKLLDGAGTVLLDIVPYGDKATQVNTLDGSMNVTSAAAALLTAPRSHCFNTPDGTTVVLFSNTKGGSILTRKESEWVIWTAEDAAQTGQPPEATPVGASMYKFGTIKTRTSDAIPGFFDASGTKVMTAKDWRAEGRNAVVLQSADGTTPMAKVNFLSPGSFWKADVTFAKGVDPIIALCVAVAGNSVAFGWGGGGGVGAGGGGG